MGTTDAFILRTRERRETEELSRLAPAAVRAVESRGRVHPEAPDRYRTAFERDRDRILHSKAFRRLKHKTQVFIDPEGDHYVTRLTHTLQVTQIARALAAALSLNETLAEAIALGHDVGHSPFGHTGEDALSPYFPTSGGWHHAAQSVRIFEVLEDLNLSWEVRDGIRAHSWRIEPPPATQEAMCVRYADRIAYLTHDALDALRAGLLTDSDFPASIGQRFGPVGSGWVGGMITAVMERSMVANVVEWRRLAGRHERAPRLHVPAHLPGARTEAPPGPRRWRSSGRLVDHHLLHPEAIPGSYRDTEADLVTQVADYVAGMTDRFALATYRRLFGRPGMADPIL